MTMQSVLVTLQENLQKLKRWKDLSLTEIAAASSAYGFKISRSVAGRALKEGDLPPNMELERLHGLALAYGVETWQLLYPGFIPGMARRDLSGYCFEAIDAANIIQAIADESKRRQVHALLVQLVEFGKGGLPPSPSLPPSA